MCLVSEWPQRCRYDGSWANDIVVDETNGYAYISDTWADGGLIVYDFARNRARRFDDASLHPDPDMSHDGGTVYYCEISRQILWSVPTAALRNWTMSNSDISPLVHNWGIKGFSDGMTADNHGRLYFGNQATSSVMSWEMGTSIESAVAVAVNTSTMQWPDTFAWDGNGGLVFVSNKLQLFAFGGMMFDGSDGANFRVWSVDVGANSYLSGDPQPPRAECLP